MTENSLLGHVSPIPALTFVLQNREKVKVRPKSLSENLFSEFQISFLVTSCSFRFVFTVEFSLLPEDLPVRPEALVPFVL